MIEQVANYTSALTRMLSVDIEFHLVINSVFVSVIDRCLRQSYYRTAINHRGHEKKLNVPFTYTIYQTAVCTN